MRPSLHALVTPNEVPRQRALTALSLMRTERLSLRRAADRAGTTPRTVHRHVGAALRKNGRRYVATPADRLGRSLQVFTADAGVVELTLRGSRPASVVGAHWNAIHRFLATGDEGSLAPFVGRSVAGHHLETDPSVIERLGRRGELQFEDLYRVSG